MPDTFRYGTDTFRYGNFELTHLYKKRSPRRYQVEILDQVEKLVPGFNHQLSKEVGSN